MIEGTCCPDGDPSMEQALQDAGIQRLFALQGISNDHTPAFAVVLRDFSRRPARQRQDTWKDCVGTCRHDLRRGETLWHCFNGDPQIMRDLLRLLRLSRLLMSCDLKSTF